MTATATSTSEYLAAPNRMVGAANGIDFAYRAVGEVLAHRAGAGIDVSLWWTHCEGVDETLVCVCNQREGAYFEISAEPYLALDVYYHPFAYRDFSTLDYEDSRLAA